MKHDIKELQPHQFEEAARVIREAFLTVAEEFGFTAENNPTNGAFIQAGKLIEDHAKGIKLFGLFADGVLAGCVAVEKSTDQLYYLEKLAVIPGQRHNGFGKLLMDHARGYVRQAGGSVLSIGIINENDRLKRWYAQYGFRETALKHYEHLTFTVCFMQLAV